MHARSLSLAAGCFGLAYLAAQPSAAETPTFRDLTVEQRPVAEIAAPESDLKVAAWVDRRDDTYRTGDTLTISIRANRDAYISVINVGSSGKVHVIFPNKHQTDGKVPAQQVLQIPAAGEAAPYQIRVGGPAGFDLIKVVATLKPHRITDERLFAEAGAFRSYGGTTEALARDLSVELKERHPAGPGSGAAVADKVIRIVAAP